MYLCFVSATLFCLFLQPCGHLQRTGWPLDSIVCCVFLCFVTFHVVLGQVRHLIVSISDLCLLSY